MKRIFALIIIYFLMTFARPAFAQEVFKVTSANFDTSNSVIVLTSPDFSEKPILPSLKLIKLENPLRAYFDIDDTILTIPKQDWTFNNGPIKQIKINQFSTNPNKVRIVLYAEDDFDFNKLDFLRVKNNIIIKIKNNNWDEDYFINTYRDDHSSVSDFYEYLTVTIPAVVQEKSDKVVEQIQQAFNSSAQQTAKPEQTAVTTVKKDLRLNTKYYLEKLTPKQNFVVVNGFGSLSVEKPMVLQNPSRVVFDIPNTLVKNDIRNTEFKINETDTAKLGQFEVNKGRIVITTPDVNKYIPIFSSDNQSLIIGNYEKINSRALINNIADVAGYHYEKNDNLTGSMILAFNHPIVHGIDRENNKLTIYLFNVQKYSEDNFKTAFANSLFNKAQITLMPQVGMKLTIPLETGSNVNTYFGADGRTLKIKVKAPKVIPVITPIPTKQTYISSSKPKVVIDAGHGGSDCGALRGDINEKDITLDIAKKVENMLKKQGYHVVMTRSDDTFVSLQDRVTISEDAKTDIFVSIHVNSSVKPEITGIETHYYRQESLPLAQTVHASLASTIKSNNRGLFKSKFYVINHTTAPAILCEIGFISNDNERKELVSEKRKNDTAKAIVEGINNYFKQAK